MANELTMTDNTTPSWIISKKVTPTRRAKTVYSTVKALLAEAKRLDAENGGNGRSSSLAEAEAVLLERAELDPESEGLPADTQCWELSAADRVIRGLVNPKEPSTGQVKRFYQELYAVHVKTANLSAAMIGALIKMLETRECYAPSKATAKALIKRGLAMEPAFGSALLFTAEGRRVAQKLVEGR